ncbi:nnp-1 protein putative nuclear protein 1 nop52 [Anaeramoeba flamelloides]|uniref:Nnp-1 protein putative nuclear protein 1 nop52 n=1 Tax=Anaeramoeba flamelloides TaxID=1746091 RepID=A0AAV8AD17_9EUKA|nr:nnp-1 protein putative nuclear protein 1 nop52 [Anaeramoeba flamelloides]
MNEIKKKHNKKKIIRKEINKNLENYTRIRKELKTQIEEFSKMKSKIKECRENKIKLIKIQQFDYQNKQNEKVNFKNEKKEKRKGIKLIKQEKKKKLKIKENLKKDLYKSLELKKTEKEFNLKAMIFKKQEKLKVTNKQLIDLQKQIQKYGGGKNTDNSKTKNIIQEYKSKINELSIIKNNLIELRQNKKLILTKYKKLIKKKKKLNTEYNQFIKNKVKLSMKKKMLTHKNLKKKQILKSKILKQLNNQKKMIKEKNKILIKKKKSKHQVAFKESQIYINKILEIRQELMEINQTRKKMKKKINKVFGNQKKEWINLHEKKKDLQKAEIETLQLTILLKKEKRQLLEKKAQIYKTKKMYFDNLISEKNEIKGKIINHYQQRLQKTKAKRQNLIRQKKKQINLIKVHDQSIKNRIGKIRKKSIQKGKKLEKMAESCLVGQNKKQILKKQILILKKKIILTQFKKRQLVYHNQMRKENEKLLKTQNQKKDLQQKGSINEKEEQLFKLKNDLIQKRKVKEETKTQLLSKYHEIKTFIKNEINNKINNEEVQMTTNEKEQYNNQIMQKKLKQKLKNKEILNQIKKEIKETKRTLIIPLEHKRKILLFKTEYLKIQRFENVINNYSKNVYNYHLEKNKIMTKLNPKKLFLHHLSQELANNLENKNNIRLKIQKLTDLKKELSVEKNKIGNEKLNLINKKHLLNKKAVSQFKKQKNNCLSQYMNDLNYSYCYYKSIILKKKYKILIDSQNLMKMKNKITKFQLINNHYFMIKKSKLKEQQLNLQLIKQNIKEKNEIKRKLNDYINIFSKLNNDCQNNPLDNTNTLQSYNKECLLKNQKKIFNLMTKIQKRKNKNFHNSTKLQDLSITKNELRSFDQKIDFINGKLYNSKKHFQEKKKIFKKQLINYQKLKQFQQNIHNRIKKKQILIFKKRNSQIKNISNAINFKMNKIKKKILINKQNWLVENLFKFPQPWLIDNYPIPVCIIWQFIMNSLSMENNKTHKKNTNKNNENDKKNNENDKKNNGAGKKNNEECMKNNGNGNNNFILFNNLIKNYKIVYKINQNDVKKHLWLLINIYYSINIFLKVIKKNPKLFGNNNKNFSNFQTIISFFTKSNTHKSLKRIAKPNKNIDGKRNILLTPKNKSSQSYETIITSQSQSAYPKFRADKIQRSRSFWKIKRNKNKSQNKSKSKSKSKIKIKSKNQNKNKNKNKNQNKNKQKKNNQSTGEKNNHSNNNIKKLLSSVSSDNLMTYSNSSYNDSSTSSPIISPSSSMFFYSPSNNKIKYAESNGSKILILNNFNDNFDLKKNYKIFRNQLCILMKKCYKLIINSILIKLDTLLLSIFQLPTNLTKTKNKQWLTQQSNAILFLLRDFGNLLIDFSAHQFIVESFFFQICSFLNNFILYHLIEKNNNCQIGKCRLFSKIISKIEKWINKNYPNPQNYNYSLSKAKAALSVIINAKFIYNQMKTTQINDLPFMKDLEEWQVYHLLMKWETDRWDVIPLKKKSLSGLNSKKGNIASPNSLSKIEFDFSKIHFNNWMDVEIPLQFKQQIINSFF